jgi:hypothetical protein
MAIGDVAIVGFPVELFTAFGRRMKAASPFPGTIVATLANGWHGYAPTLEAFDRGGYEPRFAYPSRLVPEAGDRMTDAALGCWPDWREGNCPSALGGRWRTRQVDDTHPQRDRRRILDGAPDGIGDAGRTTQRHTSVIPRLRANDGPTSAQDRAKRR